MGHALGRQFLVLEDLVPVLILDKTAIHAVEIQITFALPGHHPTGATMQHQTFTAAPPLQCVRQVLSEA